MRHAPCLPFTYHYTISFCAQLQDNFAGICGAVPSKRLHLLFKLLAVNDL